MKPMIHPDYWVEVPAGEFLIGLSQEQHDSITAHIRHQVGYEQFSPGQRELVESILRKCLLCREQADRTRKPLLSIAGLSDAEKAIWGVTPFQNLIDLEIGLMGISLLP